MDKFQWNFQENVAYDNIESHRKNRASTFLWKIHFQKTIDPPPQQF